LSTLTVAQRIFASTTRVSEHVAVIAKASWKNLFVSLMGMLCMQVIFNRIGRVCRAGLVQLLSLHGGVLWWALPVLLRGENRLPGRAS
jgi:hypothetical protein